ncbi:rRNA maturation RNase YbeY [Caldanaerobius fijiensis]|nr:rRNA maturation RNase YbeY [Caldanaerobius fijiensis]
MEVYIDDRQESVYITEELKKLLIDVVESAAKSEGFEDVEVSISIVDDEEIRKLNKEYRGIDRATDVLSFPMMDFEGDDAIIQEATDIVMLGDIVISAERAKAQAADYGHSFEREMAFLTVHGMFHLMGYDHEKPEDARVMRAKEEKILSELGIERV